MSYINKFVIILDGTGSVAIELNDECMFAHACKTFCLIILFYLIDFNEIFSI